MAPSAVDIESELLRKLDVDGSFDSGEFATTLGVDHNVVVGVIKSLESYEMIATEDVAHKTLALKESARAMLESGASHEAQVFAALPAEGGVPLSELKAKLGEAGEHGFRQAMALKWVAMDKSDGQPKVVRKVDSIQDRTLEVLKALDTGKEPEGGLPAAEVTALTKRKLITPVQWKTFSLSKGPKFALERKKPATDLTYEMLQKGTWRDAPFKEYNFAALGTPYAGGALHPLLKVRTQFRKIFTQMGFEEMPTNAYVESSFWNFDALFQPQQHPARDAHDTFFLTKPVSTSLSRIPQDYLWQVKDIHQNGGFGSIGYGYDWQASEAEKNLLRTHTTAVSSRMLYKLAQEGFKPAKYFSIDRVFRNEAVDRTHLAEFHQVEGIVCDYGLTLGDLIGVLKEFFERLGLKHLRFKPAFNPYTEPSMEIFSYSEGLGKWMEVGNSGMFRPEMLRPMGIPEGVNVIAWGLSLERPTMILYGIDNIRDLFGHKVSLNMVRTNGICRLGL